MVIMQISPNQQINELPLTGNDRLFLGVWEPPRLKSPHSVYPREELFAIGAAFPAKDLAYLPG